MRKALVPILILLASPAFAAKKDPGAQALLGHWKLVGVECKGHALGKLAEETRKMIDSRLAEEWLDFSAKELQSRTIERKEVSSTTSYCETIFTSGWKAENGRIRADGLLFKSREGKGGYKCYEPYHHLDKKVPSDWGYRVKGKRLEVDHKDVAVKFPKGEVKHECDGGGDVTMIYEKKK